MNQTAIGCYIARKRKGAESDTGAAGAAARRVQQDDLKMGERKVYAGYSIIQKLCEALPVTLPELMDGEDAAKNREQKLIFGLLMGLSIVDIMAGIIMVGQKILQQQQDAIEPI